MLNLKFKTRKSLLSFRQSVRTVCEEQGLRLGKSNKKLDHIVARILGTGCMNEAMAKVSEESNAARNLNQDDLEQLKKINMLERFFHIDMLENKEPRTLLYGYNCDMGNGSETVHVYIGTDGLIHVLTYNGYEQVQSHYYGKEVEARILRPSKRAYPSCTDKEFAFKIDTILDNKITYTSLDDDRAYSQYYGKLAENLNPVPVEFTDLVNLFWNFHDKVLELCIQKYADDNFISVRELNFSDEVNEVRKANQHLTDGIRKAVYTGIKQKELTSDMVEAVLKDFERENVISTLKSDEFDTEKFNRLLQFLFSQKGFEFNSINL